VGEPRQHGCTMGVVLCRQVDRRTTWVVAVYADLDASGGFYSAIKVVPVSPRVIRAAGLGPGTVSPLVAMFSGRNADGAFWTDLEAYLVPELTDDLDAAKRVLARVPAHARHLLDLSLKQLRPPLKWGVHRVELRGVHWPEVQEPSG
jgi:hypothetical protein